MTPCRMMRVAVPRVARVIVLVLLTTNSALAQQNRGMPRLAAALRNALEKEAPAAVEKRFLEALEAGNDEYVIDMKALNDLGVEYMQKGDIERGSVVMAVAVQAARLMMEDMLSPEMRAAAAAGNEKRADPRPRVSEEQLARRRHLERMGPPRNDLARFHGMYGRPEDNGTRLVFLVHNCDGHLTVGAAWGDVAPRSLRSIADTKFHYPGDDYTKPVNVEIIMDPGGMPARLIHDLPYISSPLPRVRDLPENYLPKCTG